ncbi:pitrilysin family protein [Elizabethkingia sp. HX WHF]|uniref:M16 family metallopeptidase n=1 Tax=Elizabethkingia TaxID=308865 RepID=UPI00099A6F69|nr:MULTISPECIES: pitrilysin family protein [Elizabethkingia]ATL43442.1 insulinase family protein [Elizabethkingia miricola]MCL1638473.1 insulinase family protein [Elizabethkingia bruuniana]MDX8564498.1 pitrilysin family protein [Elizabethkingia sp. HX WHF]OPC26287.1 peptidase M16 [Elizabethkingia bruuniana]
MNRIVLNAMLVLATVSGTVVTYAQAQQTPKFISNIEGVKQYTLNNGLQVILIPDASQTNVIVNIVYNVGSRHEGYGEKGMAHLLEHMLFKSTKKLGDIKKMLSDRGAVVNGSTWNDRTNYHEEFQSNEENLRWALEMEADRMINATILQSDLDKEFSVVRNEFEINENNPGNVLTERILSTAYLWHNYGNTTIGSKEDIERVKADRLRTFYEKYYQPDNATLVVAGKFDEPKLLQYIGQYFGTIPKPTRVLDKTYTLEPVQDGERFVELKRAGDSQIFGAAYHTVPYADKDYAALDALSEILTSDPSGYLYKSLVDTKNIASLGAYQLQLRDPGFIYFSASIPNDKDIKTTKNLVRSELDKIPTIKYTDQDVQRAKTALLKQYENRKNNTIKYAADLTEIIGAGDYRLGFLYRDNLEKLTKADIERVAQKYFTSNNRTVGVFIPSKDEKRVRSPEYSDEKLAELTTSYKGKTIEKEVAPFEASITNLKKNLTEDKTGNGMKYGFIKKEIKGEKVLAQFNFRIGDEQSLKGKAQIGSIMAQLLKTGTKKYTKEQLNDKLDALKSNIGFGFGGQSLSVNVNTYKSNFVEVMGILKEILTNATFPQEELAKSITEYNTNLESSLNDPQSIAFTEINRVNQDYPKDHIYYTPSIQERIDFNKGVKREQIIDFYQNLIGANFGAGSVIGDLDAKTVKTVLEDTFGKWNTKTKYSYVVPPFFPSKKENKVINTPDKENALALGIVHFKLDRKSPDYPAFLMANEILGSGGFINSRIPVRLREKEGISYGSGSYVNIPYINNVASWGYYAFLNPVKKDAVDKAVYEEITKALKDGFTEEELKAKKKSWQNSRKTGLGNDGTLIGLVNNKLLYNIPLEDYDELESKVLNISVQQANEALQKYLKTNQLTTLDVGDFNKK